MKYLIGLSLVLTLFDLSACELPIGKQEQDALSNISSCTNILTNQANSQALAAEAEYNLAAHHLHGIAVKRDLHQAINLFESSAKRDNTNAQFQLVLLYLDNQSVKDVSRGIEWLNLLVDSNNGFAQYRLGKIYAEGKHVEKDLKKAHLLLSQAAKQSVPAAITLLADIEADISNKMALEQVDKKSNNDSGTSIFSEMGLFSYLAITITLLTVFKTHKDLSNDVRRITLEGKSYSLATFLSAFYSTLSNFFSSANSIKSNKSANHLSSASKTITPTQSKKPRKTIPEKQATSPPKAKTAVKIKRIQPANFHCAWCSFAVQTLNSIKGKACKNSPNGTHEPIKTPTEAICRFCSQTTTINLGGHCLKSPHNKQHALREG
jgi:hypothetical protein